MFDCDHMGDTAPLDARGLAAVAARRRAHLDDWVARRLYARMKRRAVLLRRPVPTGVRERIAELLQQDHAVLIVLTSACRGRRASMAVVTTSPAYWAEERLRIDGMRPLRYAVFWPQSSTA